jgi:DNA-binding NarL/FixJ family response regulator
MQEHESQVAIALVVDDSPETLGMLNEALEMAGYTVLVALEGRQAVTIAEKIAPDIVLMDAIMPHMDGFDTCRELKTNPELANVPVLFMTGLSDTNSIIQALDCGGVDYLCKPIVPDELIARMRVHLANARKTTSAHNALDSTGQHLFTLDMQGRVLWSTPQTQALLKRAKVTQEWLVSEFSSQLLTWLDHEPKPNQSLKLKGSPKPLEVRLLERGPGQTILRLMDASAPTGAEHLQQALPLTQRESQVLYWIGSGKTNREIGQILDNSPRTVNKHLEQIFRKLEVSNRTSAAAIAIRILADD